MLRGVQGVHRVIYAKEAIDERIMRIAISTYGNLKRVAALLSVQKDEDFTGFKEAAQELQGLLKVVHDPLTWKNDIDSRVKEIRYGQW